LIARRARALSLACFASAALAVGTPGAEASTKAIWGPTTLPDGSSAFPLYRSLGVDVLEEQLSWQDVATVRPASPQDPTDPAYRWPAALDATVAEASGAGISVALMVKYTPGWANGGRSAARVPTNVGDYADFLVAAARHYPGVRLWMIWGEPTRAGSFEPMGKGSRAGPRAYARLLDRAYGALKRESPRNTVIGGMTWTLGTIPPATFVRWMRRADGRPPRLDWYGHNPFSTRYPRLSKRPYFPGLRDMSDLDTLHDEVVRAYRGTGRRPRLWLSEFTVPSDHANRAFTFFVSRQEQAHWLSAAFRIGDRTPYVAGIGWYSLLDEPDPINGFTGGLLDAQGAPKPALAAYRAAP